MDTEPHYSLSRSYLLLSALFHSGGHCYQYITTGPGHLCFCFTLHHSFHLLTPHHTRRITHPQPRSSNITPASLPHPCDTRCQCQPPIPRFLQPPEDQRLLDSLAPILWQSAIQVQMGHSHFHSHSHPVTIRHYAGQRCCPRHLVIDLREIQTCVCAPCRNFRQRPQQLARSPV